MIFRAPDAGPEAGWVAMREHADPERNARRLDRFAAVPDGAFVWTRDADGAYRLGRITGPPGEDPTVRPAQWLERPFGEDEVPVAVAATFARGGGAFQRTHDAAAERRTAKLWDEQSLDRPESS